MSVYTLNGNPTTNQNESYTMDILSDGPYFSAGDTVHVDWGDGYADDPVYNSAGGALWELSHLYSAPGTFTISAIINGDTDDPPAPKSVQVQYVAPGRPSVSNLSVEGSQWTNSTLVHFLVSFDKQVTGVDPTDFALSASGLAGSSLVSVDGGGTDYVVTANTGDGEGTLSLYAINNGSIQDSDGNPLDGTGPTAQYVIDRTPPTVTLDSIATGDFIRTQNAVPLSGSAGFSYDIPTVLVNVGGWDATQQMWTPVWYSYMPVEHANYYGNGQSLSDGDYVAWAEQEDLAGNVGISNMVFFTKDTVAPAVTSISAADATISQPGTLHYHIAFTEPTTGLDPTDFTLIKSGYLPNAFIYDVSGSGTSYDVTVQTGEGAGTLNLQLVDNDTVVDQAGNPLGGTGAGNGTYSAGLSQKYTVVPVASDDEYWIHQGQSLLQTFGVSPNLSDNDSNYSEPDAAFILGGQPHGTAILRSDGTLEYTPAAGFVGDDTFTYVITAGGVTSAPATVTIHVTDIAPTAAHHTFTYDSLAWASNSSHVLSASLPLDRPYAPYGDRDADGDPLTYTLLQDDSHGTLHLNPDGTFTYIPDTGYHGQATFTYKISDGALWSNEATVTLSVYPDPIVGGDSYLDCPAGQSAIFDPAWYGSWFTGGAPPIVTIANPGSAQYGTFLPNSDGTWTYTAGSQYNTGNIIDNITLTASGGQLTSPWSSTLHVIIHLDQEVNIPPTWGILLSTPHDQPRNINDVYVENSDYEQYQFTQPTHGSIVTDIHGTWSYVPTSGFVGWDSFTLAIQYLDGQGHMTDYATYRYMVNVTDAIPEPNDNFINVQQNTPYTADAAHGVLTGLSDPEGDPMVLQRIHAPDHGTLTLSADGSYTYKPVPGYVGRDYFTYVLKGIDGTNSPVGIVWINVQSWHFNVNIPVKQLRDGYHDQDGDLIPDFADGYDRDPADAHDNFAAGHFETMTITVPDWFNLNQLILSIAYTNPSDPTTVGSHPGGTADDPYTYYTASGHLRIWKKEEFLARNPAALGVGGDYLPPGFYTAGQLGITADSRYVTLYIEGVNAGNDQITVSAYPSGNVNDVPSVIVNNIAVVDPSPQNRTDWQNNSLTAAGINLQDWTPEAGFARQRTNVEHAYAYYESLYHWSVINSSERFMWAGLAKLAGGPVYGALEDLTRAETDFRARADLWGNRPLGLAANYFANKVHAIAFNLLAGQQAIFLDLAWQFEAYKQKGLDALDEVFFRDHPVAFRRTAYVAWQRIDTGVLANIVSGNTDLLNIEQQRIIQPFYDEIDRLAPIVPTDPSFAIPGTSLFIPLRVGTLMGAMVQNPVPGALTYWQYPPTAGNDLGNYDKRWQWLRDCMMPAFTGVARAIRASWISDDLVTRANSTRAGDSAIDAIAAVLFGPAL